MAETTGGAIIARMLQTEGVGTFFAIPDGTYLQLFAPGRQVFKDMHLEPPGGY